MLCVNEFFQMLYLTNMGLQSKFFLCLFPIFFVITRCHRYHHIESDTTGASLPTTLYGSCASDHCDCHNLYLNSRYRCSTWLYNNLQWFSACTRKQRCLTPIRHCCLVATWSQCDQSCDGGVQTRIVRCADTVGGLSHTCTTTTTTETRSCNPQACPIITNFDCTATTPFINEFHYDDASTDEDEFIEIAGLAGTDLSGYIVELYNGNTNSKYDEKPLGILSDDGVSEIGFFAITYSVGGIQNGSPDGIAIIDDNNNVVQFISYEGTFTPTDGNAIGLTSTDIGIEEDGSTVEGTSLQLIGSGCDAADFTWTKDSASTKGVINAGQTFTTA